MLLPGISLTFAFSQHGDVAGACRQDDASGDCVLLLQTHLQLHRLHKNNATLPQPPSSAQVSVGSAESPEPLFIHWDSSMQVSPRPQLKHSLLDIMNTGAFSPELEFNRFIMGPQAKKLKVGIAVCFGALMGVLGLYSLYIVALYWGGAKDPMMSEGAMLQQDDTIDPFLVGPPDPRAASRAGARGAPRARSKAEAKSPGLPMTRSAPEIVNAWGFLCSQNKSEEALTLCADDVVFEGRALSRTGKRSILQVWDKLGMSSFSASQGEWVAEGEGVFQRRVTVKKFASMQRMTLIQHVTVRDGKITLVKIDSISAPSSSSFSPSPKMAR